MGPNFSVRAAARRERARAAGYVGDAKRDEPDAGWREGDVREGHGPHTAHPPPAPCRSGGAEPVRR